ncbi:MAG: FKBP-type peptidylprolyl isomerase [Bacteroidota bacterium]
MNKFKFYFILLITTVTIFSCSKNDDDGFKAEPIRDYQTQYNTDIAIIEDYLNSNYITVTDAPGQTTDQDVIITKIPAGGTQPSIMSYLNSPTFPKLLSRNIELNSVTYKLYYLVLREGTGDSPCNVDGVFSSYRGDYLYRTIAKDAVVGPPAEPAVPSELRAVKFEEVIYPYQFLSLYTTVIGWSEIFPQFKTGTYITNPDGTVTYNDFGAGVMFIPSGLGYYNSITASIPAYSPLVFSFKSYQIKRLDQDNDGIPSYLEDNNSDGYMKVLKAGETNPDDTDGDGVLDFLDVDDDGDKVNTKVEIKNPATGFPYPFADIPTCTPLGKKNYLDATCHP